MYKYGVLMSIWSLYEHMCTVVYGNGNVNKSYEWVAVLFLNAKMFKTRHNAYIF